MRVRSIRNRAGQQEPVDALAPATALPTQALSETDAARYIGMSPAWLKKSRTQRFCRVTDAPPFVRAGVKRVVYRRQDLDAWQERHLERVGPIRASISESDA